MQQFGGFECQPESFHSDVIDLASGDQPDPGQPQIPQDLRAHTDLEPLRLA